MINNINPAACFGPSGRCQQTAPCQVACNLRLQQAHASKELALTEALKRIELFCLKQSKYQTADPRDLALDLEFAAKMAGDALSANAV